MISNYIVCFAGIAKRKHNSDDVQSELIQYNFDGSTNADTKIIGDSASQRTLNLTEFAKKITNSEIRVHNSTSTNMKRINSIVYHMIILFVHSVCSSGTASRLQNKQQQHMRQQQLSVKINCTRDAFNIKLDMDEPFRGLVFAKDFVDECRVRGDIFFYPYNRMLAHVQEHIRSFHMPKGLDSYYNMQYTSEFRALSSVSFWDEIAKSSHSELNVRQSLDTFIGEKSLKNTLVIANFRRSSNSILLLLIRHTSYICPFLLIESSYCDNTCFRRSDNEY